jgi:hypothetical protein
MMPSSTTTLSRLYTINNLVSYFDFAIGNVAKHKLYYSNVIPTTKKNLYFTYQKMTDIICIAGLEWCVFKKARNRYKFKYHLLKKIHIL